MKTKLAFKLTVPVYLLFILTVVLAITIGKHYFYQDIIKKHNKVIDHSYKVFNNTIQYFLNELTENNKLAFSEESFSTLLASCDTLSNNECNNLISEYINNKRSLIENYDIYIFSTEEKLLFSNAELTLIYNKNFNEFFSVVKKKNKPDEQLVLINNKLYLISIYPVLYYNTTIGYTVLLKDFVQAFKTFNNFFVTIVSPTKDIIFTNNKFDENLINSFPDLHNATLISGNSVFKSYEFNIKNKLLGYIIISSNLEDDLKSVNDFILYLLIFSITVLVVGGFIYFAGIKRILIHPLKIIEQKIKSLSKGEIVKELDIKNKDEIKAISDALNNLIKNFRGIVKFLRKLESGNYDAKLEMEGMNELGSALEDLKNNLKESKKLQKEKEKEDNIRHWTASGLAKFGNILRKYNDNIKETFDELLKELVHYVDVEQGAILIINEEYEGNDKYLEIISTYAYNRHKYHKNRISLGEGISGEVVLEGKSIYISDLPEDYATITSGLGEAKPKYLFVAPLKLEDETYGAIELASFHEIEEYKRNFVEQLAENIASTIKNIKVNEKTKKLLDKFQEQSEAIKAQEEILKQNLEELQATQEDLMQKEEELNTLTYAIEAHFVKIELDKNGIITNINKQAENLLGISPNQIIGKHISEIATNDLTHILSSLEENNEPIPTQLTITNEEEEKTIISTFIPFVFENRLSKILIIGVLPN